VSRHPLRDQGRAATCRPESKAKVNEIADNAIEAGGRKTRDPQDHGFMFGRSFEDPDGQIWEIIWMVPSAVKQE
jgi:predicted lactoylglutathione lyase